MLSIFYNRSILDENFSFKSFFVEMEEKVVESADWQHTD